MRYLLTESSRKIARASDRINRIYGARYKWTVLHSARDFAYVYKYVYRNPVRAEVCSNVENYSFSTLTKLMQNECRVPICERTDELSILIPKSRDERLKWLNQPTAKEAEALVGKALRRFEFKFTSDNKEQKKLRTLSQQYNIDLL